MRFFEDGENLIMQMPAPYLFDKDGAFSFDVGISLKQTGDQYLLTYMLPQEWLADTERQWPVVLDPVVSCVANNSNAEDQTVYENTNMYSAHTSLAINSGYNTSCKSMRTYIRYNNLPELTSADMIVSASIELYATEKEGASTTLEIREVLETETIGSAAYSYSYDSAGNILTATNSTGSHTYTYGDSSWGDLLTKYDGQSITYDAIGNPTSYYNGTRWTFTWTNGRELTTASNGTNDISYTYGADGLRTSKTVDGEVYTYYYMGDKLVRMTVGTDTVMDFTYDQNGQPYCVTQNGVVSYYVLNQQGDVVRIVNANGATRGVYRYDAWGNLLYITDSDFMRLNPLRYRGYVYDNETGLYYVSSRYYDPEIGRFISADAYAATGQGILGNNMFAYCGNNPVVRADPSGESFAIVLGFNFNLFGWGMIGTINLVSTEDNLGVQYSYYISDDPEISEKSNQTIGVDVGPYVGVQYTGKKSMEKLEGYAKATGGDLILGIDVLTEEDGDYLGWQFGSSVFSANMHSLYTNTETLFSIPTIDLVEIIVDWIFGEK